MIINKKENAARNILFGVLLKVHQIMVPFAVRTILIYTLGMQYLGLNSLFSSILQMLNMAELGVGSAMVYSMYRPIAEDDTDKICKLMNLYRKYYRIIGLVILTLGIILLPFIPRLVKGDLPQGIDIYILYILNLLATVFSYWLFSYKNSILMVLQRNDITHILLIATTTIQYVGQIIVLIITRNYYLYLVIALVSQILNNIFTAMYVSKKYPHYDSFGKLEENEVREINKRIADLFTSKIGGTIVTSSDSIIISAYLGLMALGVYNNYFYICTSISGFVMIIFYSFTAGIGNSIITESPQKVYDGFNKLTFLTVWITGFCTCCLVALYQPFMEIWVGRKNMLGIDVVIGLCIYFYINLVNLLLNSYKDAAGIWNRDKYRTLTVALVNLVMSIALVNVIGIYGVLLATVLSKLLIGTPWILYNLFAEVFKDGLMQYTRRLLYYTVVVFGASLATFFICQYIGAGFTGLIIRAVVCVIVSNIIFYAAFRTLPEFDYSFSFFKGYANKILKRY